MWINFSNKIKQISFIFAYKSLLTSSILWVLNTHVEFSSFEYKNNNKNENIKKNLSIWIIAFIYFVTSTLKIRAESQESCAVIAKEVKQAIRMANASHCLKLFNLRETNSNNEHFLLDQNICRNLIMAKVLPRLESDSNATIIIDRTGAVDIFGLSPAAVAKAKQLMENFSNGDQQTGSATTKTNIPDMQPQPPQQENATTRNDNNIPNDPPNTVPKTGFHGGGGGTGAGIMVNTEYRCIFIDRWAVGMVIGSKGAKRLEFEKNYNVRVNILSDRKDAAQEDQVQIDIRGKVNDDVHRAGEAILEYVKSFDRRRSGGNN